jgi:predicted metalloprotease with PDZ domain
MYFAVVDARVRKASGGKRSLDDLVLEMNQRRGAKPDAKSDAKPVDMAALWPQLLVRELGPSGTALHEAMLAGEVIVPESDDFGPCFKRTVKKVRRFELGFEPASLVGDVKTIRGLQAGGEAAKAGLRDGDVVTYAVAMDKIQGEQDAKLTLNVTRDGRRFPVTYLPRGERVQVWQWQRAPGVADSDCRL